MQTFVRKFNTAKRSRSYCEHFYVVCESPRAEIKQKIACNLGIANEEEWAFRNSSLFAALKSHEFLSMGESCIEPGKPAGLMFSVEFISNDKPLELLF